MSVRDDNDTWPRKCSRCGTKIESIEHYHVNHGWDEFCDSCEESYNKWYEKDKQK